MQMFLLLKSPLLVTLEMLAAFSWPGIGLINA